MPNDFQTAAWYDAIYADVVDYDATAERIDASVRRYLGDGPVTLLDVACGTGRFIESLGRFGRYTLQGTDLDPRMLAVARQRLPDVPLTEADMAELSLGQTFDVVTCLGSSLPAVGGTDRLNQAIYRLAAHLKPAGIMIIEGFIHPDDWEDGRLSANFVDRPDLKIARMVRSSRRDDLAVMDMQYLIATPESTQQFVERHELGLYTDDDWKRAFGGAGLHASKDATGLLNRATWLARHKHAAL